MPEQPPPHSRSLLRLPAYDYSSAGAYFVTLCTHERETFLGSAQGDAICTSEIGQAAESLLKSLPALFKPAQLDSWIIMPDHIHCIWILGEDGQPTKAATLGTVIGTYKSRTARLINAMRRTPGAPVWQRNYYEHVIRNEDELNRIREYMMDNPRRWMEKHGSKGEG